jgi:hypothetical protein
MEYVGINEEYQDWRETWQDSNFMADLTVRQRERDFREGYMRGFEMATKEGNKKTLKMILDSWDQGLLQEIIAYADKNKPEVTRVEVIQHSPPYNGRAYTNYAAKEVEVQYQDGGRTLKIFCK